MKKAVAYALTFLLLALTGNAESKEPWGPREMAYRNQLEQLHPRIITCFLLGLHGELFWTQDAYRRPFLEESLCLAVRKEDGTGIELLAERDLQFIVYANVSGEGDVMYADTSEARALTDNGFCGIRQWPNKDLEAGPPKEGKVKVFAELPSNLPRRPDGCESVAYSLSDGGFLFFQPDGIFSPYPLWLMRANKKRLILTSSEGAAHPLLEIAGFKERACHITVYKDSRQKVLTPPWVGLYGVRDKFIAVPAPTKLLYISKTLTNNAENMPSSLAVDENAPCVGKTR